MNIEEKKMLIAALGQMIAEETNKLRAKIIELEMRVNDIEISGIKYLGTYQKSCDYKRGSVVTHDGAMWVCVVDAGPTETPGQSNRWQLSVKRDARRPTIARALHDNSG
jgi:hypothetical protein